MSLTAKDKASVKAFWAKISKSADAIGADAMGRLLYVYPQTKAYFKYWEDLTPGSEPVKNYAKKIMAGIALAVSHIDNLTLGLADLSRHHSQRLKIDPANFKFLTHCIIVVISMMYPDDFTPDAHIALDKFLCAVTAALCDKYR